MKLVQDAEIAPEKLTRYLLVKRPVGDKSEFLKRAGYALDNWQQLEQDIRQQVLGGYLSKTNCPRGILRN